MTKVKAIKAKHQNTVNRFVYWADKYNLLVNENNEIEGRTDVVPGNRAKLQEQSYDKAFNLFDDLPKRERLNVCRQSFLYDNFY